MSGPRSSPSGRPRRRSTRALGAAAERRARWFYRLRGYRILDANVRAGPNELDLVVRRGDRIVFCEVKSKGGERFGDPLAMVDEEKQRRVRRAAEAWLATRPAYARCGLAFEVVAVRGARVERVRDAF